MRNMRSRNSDDLVRTWRKGRWVEPGGAVGGICSSSVSWLFPGAFCYGDFNYSQGDDDVVGFVVDK